MPKKKETVIEIDAKDIDTIFGDTESPTPESTEPMEPAGPTDKELDAARDRRDAEMRKLNLEVIEMKESARIARQEANSYKKPLADLEAKLTRIIQTDPRGYLLMEKEERQENARPLLDKMDDWRELPVEKLDLPEKDREKLIKAEFENCGKISDWLSRDFPEKKPGCNRQDFKDRLRGAINKISGSDAMVQEELAKVDEAKPDLFEMPEQQENVVRDEEEVDEFLDLLNVLINSDEYDFAFDTLAGIRSWVAENKCYTVAQKEAVTNIESSKC